MKKVIVVESDPEQIRLYRQLFQKAAFDVELARTKEEILEELRQIRNGDSPKPDLVVMDFMLADGHGAEVLKAIKKSHFTRDIPVFALTNYQNHEFEAEARRLRIAPDKYMIKAHHTPAEVLGEMERCLGQRPPGPNRPRTRLS